MALPCRDGLGGSEAASQGGGRDTNMTNATSNGAAQAQKSEALDIRTAEQAEQAFAEGKLSPADFAAHIKRFAMADAKAQVQSTERKPSITRIEYVAPGSPTRRGNGQTVYAKLLVGYKASPNASEAEVFLNVTVWDMLLKSKDLAQAVKAHS